jgi:hypothetical protein
MIKLLVHTVSSKRDVYGNCYHSATFTSTRTGSQFSMRDTGGENNAAHFARKAGLDWDEVSSTQATLPIRQYNAVVRSWQYMRWKDIESAIRALVEDDASV